MSSVMVVLARQGDHSAHAVADLKEFQGFHETPLLASFLIKSYGSLAFNKTQLFRLTTNKTMLI